MNALQHQCLEVNGITLSLHSAGPATGRPVWLLHGFPECWHSWRQQIGPLAAAGYRVLVPEMRGYGQSSAPREAAAYDLITLCGDIQAAMDALGQDQACVVGHDWGAPVAWHLALLEPGRVQAVVGMAVPFAGRPKQPAIDIIIGLDSGLRVDKQAHLQALGQLAHHQLMGAGQQPAQLVVGDRQVCAVHADPVRPCQVGRRADAGAIDVAKEQIAVDLERQVVAEEVEDGKHLVSGDREHLVVTPFEVFAGAR